MSTADLEKLLVDSGEMSRGTLFEWFDKLLTQDKIIRVDTGRQGFYSLNQPQYWLRFLFVLIREEAIVWQNRSLVVKVPFIEIAVAGRKMRLQGGQKIQFPLVKGGVVPEVVELRRRFWENLGQTMDRFRKN